MSDEVRKNKNFQKNCQIIWFFVVIFWYTDSWLSGDCQAIVWMVCWWKELSDVRNYQMIGIVSWKKCQLWVCNSDYRNSMRWQNPENRSIGITTFTYWADVWHQICPTGASTLPHLRKHLASLGQASCPFVVNLLVNELAGVVIFQ